MDATYVELATSTFVTVLGKDTENASFMSSRIDMDGSRISFRVSCLEKLTFVAAKLHAAQDMWHHILKYSSTRVTYTRPAFMAFSGSIWPDIYANSASGRGRG